MHVWMTKCCYVTQKSNQMNNNFRFETIVVSNLDGVERNVDKTTEFQKYFPKAILLYTHFGKPSKCNKLMAKSSRKRSIPNIFLKQYCFDQFLNSSFLQKMQKRSVGACVPKLLIFSRLEAVEKTQCNGNREKFIFRISHSELTEHASQEIEHVFELKI